MSEFYRPSIYELRTQIQQGEKLQKERARLESEGRLDRDYSRINRVAEKLNQLRTELSKREDNLFELAG